MKDPAVALEIVKAMRKAGLILDIESDSGSIANYLGIQIQEEDDGTLFSHIQVSSIEFLRQWISRMPIQRIHQRRKPSERTNNHLLSTANTTINLSSE
jgi:hypothetical protein